jgi:ABC-type uncharacterized transport system substrate-binding protein
MSIKFLNKILSVLFLLVVSLFLIYKAVERPRVLVLHSYATDFSWTADMNSGVKRALADRPYNIRYYYMDTKKHPGLAYRERVGEEVRKLVREWKPSVILAFDDNAQEFVGKYFVNDPDINIVYAGVNADLARYGYDKADNVCGISEKMPWAVAQKVLLELLDKNSRLLHLSDGSDTSYSIHRSITDFDWKPFVLAGSKPIGDFDEWKKAVKDAEGKADCLLITHYHTIMDPENPDKVVRPVEVIAWTREHTDLPMLGFWRFFMEDGGMMAVGLSPYEQGEVAGRMAIDIIEKGIKAGEIGQKANRLFVMYIRKSAFYKRLPGRKIPVELEAFADAVEGTYE